jgi:hypothetical protein
VAAALAPFLEAGCRRFNVVPEADAIEAAIDAVAEVKTLLSDAGSDAGTHALTSPLSSSKGRHWATRRHP